MRIVPRRITNAINDYRTKFFSFEDGVEVNDAEFKTWMHDCVKSLSKEHPFSSMASGNAIVIAHLNGPDDETGKYEITIIACKKYKEYTTFGVDIDEVDKLNKPKHFFDINN